MLDATAWITLAGFVCSSCFTIAVILYNRGKADENAKALATTNRQESIGRFQLNEARIADQGVRIDHLDADVKSLGRALMENSVLLARIDERTMHMVTASQRIEENLERINNGKSSSSPAG